DPALAAPQVPLLAPALADPALGCAPLGSDPLSSLAPLLPAAMGGFPAPTQVGSPADSLAGLAGPLAGLSSQLGSLRDEPAKHDIAAGDAKTDDGGEPDGKNKKGTDSSPASQQQQPAASATRGQAFPPMGPTPVAAQPPTAVQLPDGSTVTARPPAVAAAVKSCLAGTPLDVAYRQAGIELPPPGTPVTNPVDPSALTP